MTADPQTVSRSLVAVVVTHNRLAKLKPTLARLLESAPAHLRAVVVVDNASDDGTGAWLAACSDPRLEVLTCATNSGGAGGFAAGMKHAAARFDPDWLVVMDDDARPAPEALAAFHALPEARWDAVAAAVYFPDGTICEMNRPSRNPFWRGREFLRTALGGGRSGFHIPPSAYEGPGLQVDVTSFVGFFISRRALALAGYPDPRLFIYGDDGIYTLDLSARGGRIGFEPGVRFEHDLTTFEGAGRRFRPLWKVYYYHRNLLLLYRRAAGWLFLPACLVILPRWGLNIRHHRGHRGIFLRLLSRAVADGMRGRLDLPHEAVLALSGERRVSSSGCPGDSGPEAPGRETAG